MVSHELLAELRQIVKEDYLIELRNDEVSDIGNSLCNFFEQLAKLGCENKYENENYRNKLG